MSEPLTSDLIVELRSEAQNEYMIDQYYLSVGKLLNRAADEIERLRATLEEIMHRAATDSAALWYMCSSARRTQCPMNLATPSRRIAVPMNVQKRS